MGSGSSGALRAPEPGRYLNVAYVTAVWLLHSANQSLVCTCYALITSMNSTLEVLSISLIASQVILDPSIVRAVESGML
jgi:hypothetical protein